MTNAELAYFMLLLEFAAVGEYVDDGLVIMILGWKVVRKHSFGYTDGLA